MVYIPKDPTKLSKAKKSKYRNKIVYAQGKKFDSVRERDRFFYLQEAKRRGEIRNLRCQVPFDIVVEGQHICKYIADFVYERASGGGLYFWPPVVEDVKARATKTDTYMLKKKLMNACHGIEIKEVFEPTASV